jgi:hypothetical protein
MVHWQRNAGEAVAGGGGERSSHLGFPNGNEGGSEGGGGIAAGLRRARACGGHGVPLRAVGAQRVRGGEKATGGVSGRAGRRSGPKGRGSPR